MRRPVLMVRDEFVAPLQSAMPGDVVLARNPTDLTRATSHAGSVALIDVDLLDSFSPRHTRAPVLAIMDRPPADALRATVELLDKHPWLSHVVHVAHLATPSATEHLQLVIDRLSTGRQQLMLGAEGVGRVALLACASKRTSRFERMREFFVSHGVVGERTLATINDVAEELVMNALYNAPAEGGYFATPRSRADDVELPDERACEISYGLEGPTAFVRVRDTFGALTRGRLQQVLNRFVRSVDVRLDESRGGAGLGMWRIFSSATSVTITVIPSALTDIIVAIDTKAGRRSTRPSAVHLYFGRRSQRWDGVPVINDEQGMVEQSFTYMHA